MDVSISVVGEPASADIRSLYQWLVAEGELRGRVQLDQPAPAPGTLGGLVDALVVGLGPSGVATALVSALIAWIRRRAGSLTIKITRPDGSSIELVGEHVRHLDADMVRNLIEQQSRMLLMHPTEIAAAAPQEDPTSHG